MEHFPVKSEACSPKPGRSWKKELLGFLCLLLALAVFCGAASAVVSPKRYDYGAVWGMYEKEPKNTVDLLFFGSSLAYCDFVPAVIYEETGVTSFVMAGPKQTAPVTYRYLRQACKTQSPKTVFIEVTRFLCPRQNDSIKINLTYMPWGLERLIPTFEETSGEERTGLLFPLYAYHDRWDDLKWADLQKGLTGYDPDPLAGYTFLDQALDLKEPVEREFSCDETDYAAMLSYAGEMADFCREKGIRLVFFFSPSYGGGHEDMLRGDLKRVCPDVEFVDFNEDFDSIGLDLSTDFYDDHHLNYRGAEKFSRYFCGRLSEWGITPSHSGDGKLWQGRIEHFAALREKWDASPVRPSPAKKGGKDNEF